jgi:hypothetical protein
MGSKPSNALKAKRPETGGTIKMDVQEQSGLIDAQKEEFAQSQHEKNEKNDAQNAAMSQADEQQQNPASHRITGHEDERSG